MEGVPETARGFGRRPAAGSSGGRLQQQRKPVFTPVEGVPEKDLSFGRTPFNRQAASAAAQLERALEAAAAGGGGSSEVTTGAATNSAGPGEWGRGELRCTAFKQDSGLAGWLAA
jgi:hypothetical protein